MLGMADSFPLPPRLQAILDALPLAGHAFTPVPRSIAVRMRLAAICARRSVTFVTFAPVALGRPSNA